MPARRRYGDACGAAHALDLVGERWALLVARELMLGPRRFTDLRHGLPGISPNVLTQRLEEMEEAAILRRVRLPAPVSAWVYELTDWGKELEPILGDIGRWAARSPTKPQGLPMSVNSLVLSFRTMFSRPRAAGFNATLRLRLEDQDFRARVAHGNFTITPGPPEAPDASLSGPPTTIAGIVYGGASMAQPGVETAGDMEVLRRFVTLFPLPERAPAATAGSQPRGT